MLFGFGNYLVPLMIGARDMAFPRLNAFGYWVFLFSGLFVYSSYLIGHAPNDGWFNYAPLSSQPYSPGLNIDFCALGLAFLGISTTVGAVNFIVTIFKLRAPGMTFNRMPSVRAGRCCRSSLFVVFALPALTVANVMLELDRRAGFHFFDPKAGGDVLLWQHLFWIFGHPDVYIIVLPATGMMSLDAARLRPAQDHRLRLAGRWPGVDRLHQLRGVGAPHVRHRAAGHHDGLLLGGQPHGDDPERRPVLRVDRDAMARPATVHDCRCCSRSAFLLIFVLGGITGVMVASVPFDRQVTDSYFVVAHFHYVLIGGVVFPIFGGLLLLGAEDDGPDDERAAGQGQLLVRCSWAST